MNSSIDSTTGYTLDLSKFYCVHHPRELVTNFCEKSECLVGLCAHCICEHTQIHTRTKTSPKYQSIRECHEGVENELKNIILSLKDCDERTSQVKNLSAEKKKEIKQLIQTTKTTVIFHVEEVFKQISSQIDQKIEEEEEKNNFHTHFQLESISQQISRQIGEINQFIANLNTPHFLSTIKKLKKEDFQYFLANKNKITQDVKNNEIFQPLLALHKEKFIQLETSLKKMFSLNFKYPPKNEHPKPQKTMSPMKILQYKPSTSFTVMKPVVMSNLQNLPPKYIEHPRNMNHAVEMENKAQKSRLSGLTVTKSRQNSISKKEQEDLAKTYMI